MTNDSSPSTAGRLLGPGLFLIVAGIIICYSGLFAWSGVMMIIGIAVGMTGMYLFLVGCIRWVWQQHTAAHADRAVDSMNSADTSNHSDKSDQG